jgi:hypothetical protein
VYGTPSASCTSKFAVYQDTPKDAWLVCGGVFGNTENCPDDIGPDYDFGASPILRTLPNGHRVLVARQKSGIVWAHDPEHSGAVVWKVQLPEKLALGEITFGGAADDRYAYFGVSSAGVAAVDLATGEKRWRRCKRRPPNTKSPAARVSKVEGSGTLAVASTVVFGWSKTVEFTKAANEVMLNVPGINVGAAVVPVYIWGWPKSGDPSPSVQDAAVVPLKQIKNPPPFVPLKNRIKVGVIATDKVSRV